MSVPPDETELISDLADKTDEEIADLVLADLRRVLVGHDVDAFVQDTMVTWYMQGELELSPEYCLEALPHLEGPIGSIHLCGDYTHPVSFLARGVVGLIVAILAMAVLAVTVAWPSFSSADCRHL